MKTAEDFRRSIGPVPPEFEQTVVHTLHSLQRKEEKNVKKKIGFVLAFALLLIATGTAFAADWNLASLLDLWQPAPAATENPTLQFDTPGDVETEWAIFRVHQAYHNGHSVYAVVEAVPKDPDTMIFVMDYSGRQNDAYLENEVYDQQRRFQPENYTRLPMNLMGPDFADCSLTVGEYLRENGKKALYLGYLSLTVDQPADADSLGSAGFDQITRKDGSALLLCRKPCDTEEKEIACHMDCFLSDTPGYFTWQMPSVQTATLRMTVPNSPVQKKAVFEGPVSIKVEIDHWQGPISVDWVKASFGPFGADVYVSWHFDAPPASDEWYGVGVPAFCSFSLGEGYEAPFDPAEYSLSEWSPENPPCYGVQHASFPAVTELPQTVSLTCQTTTVAVTLIPEAP